MKDGEPTRNRGVQHLWRKFLSGKNMSTLKKRWADLSRKKSLEKTREEKLLQYYRDLHWLNMKRAELRAPDLLRVLRTEESAKEFSTHQESIIVATHMVTRLLDELNQLAATSPQEVDDFVKKAKSSLDALASSHF